MKHLNIPLDDETYHKLKEVKGNRSWDQALAEEFEIDF